MEETKPKLNLLENTTLIYAFLTFLGYSYIDFYYDFWGIRINSFLDISEILPLFLNNINYLLLNVVINLIFYSGIMYYMNLDFVDRIHITRGFMPSKNIRLLVLIIVPVFLLLIVWLSYIMSQIRLLIIIYINAFIIMAFYAFYHKLPLILEKLKLTISRQSQRIFLIIVYLYIFNFTCVVYKVGNISSKQRLTFFSFNYESFKYQSNDSLFYIGATSKYIFLRNTKSETNLIFEKGNIKNLSLVENKPK
jgi:hypothetical protein